MIALWALLTEEDVEAYAGSLVLPRYLAHLRLESFRFATQSPNRDGRDPLKLLYSGSGRLEEYRLDPTEHAVGMIRFLCPRIDLARIRLPRDDAFWHWSTTAQPPQPMRVYFAPTTETLSGVPPMRPSEEAYVSVSRGHVFIGRRVVEEYLKAWFKLLGIVFSEVECQFGTAIGVEFATGMVGGQFLLDSEATAQDVVRFAGLKTALAHVGESARLDFHNTEGRNGIFEDGIYLPLSKLPE
jgi:hypothetical protein